MSRRCRRIRAIQVLVVSVGGDLVRYISKTKMPRTANSFPAPSASDRSAPRRPHHSPETRPFDPARAFHGTPDTFPVRVAAPPSLPQCIGTRRLEELGWTENLGRRGVLWGLPKMRDRRSFHVEAMLTIGLKCRGRSVARRSGLSDVSERHARARFPRPDESVLETRSRPCNRDNLQDFT